MAEPERKSENPAEANGTDEKQSRLRKSNQAHEKQTKHNDQPYWVACEEAASFKAKRHNYGWIRLGAVSDKLAHIKNLSIPPNVYTPQTRNQEPR